MGFLMMRQRRQGRHKNLAETIYVLIVSSLALSSVKRPCLKVRESLGRGGGDKTFFILPYRQSRTTDDVNETHLLHGCRHEVRGAISVDGRNAANDPSRSSG